MTRRFDDLEEDLRGRVLHMGALAEQMLRTAVAGLVERSPVSAAHVAAMEEQVNALHLDVDDRCLKLIALHQPAGTDLRLILAASRIHADLERIGDQAVNISESAHIMLARDPQFRELYEVPRMAELAGGMLRDALEAFARRDPELARQVLQRDEEEDHLKGHVFRELVHLMLANPATIQGGLGLILIARNLERAADHATNVAEDVIFMVLGRDIRHHALQNPA